MWLCGRCAAVDWCGAFVAQGTILALRAFVTLPRRSRAAPSCRVLTCHVSVDKLAVAMIAGSILRVFSVGSGVCVPLVCMCGLCVAVACCGLVCGSGNDIGDTGTRHLAEAFKSCPRLQSVDVSCECGQFGLQ